MYIIISWIKFLLILYENILPLHPQDWQKYGLILILRTSFSRKFLVLLLLNAAILPQLGHLAS
jgi:hypothetical protein